MTTHSVPETPQDMPGQHRDVSGHLKDALDGYTDLAETCGWDLQIFISLADVNLSVRDFYDNIKMSWWALVTTGYLDPNTYKKGKGKATSQIELRSQNGQTEQRSYANSTFNITNGEADGVYNKDSEDPEDIGSGHG